MTWTSLVPRPGFLVVMLHLRENSADFHSLELTQPGHSSSDPTGSVQYLRRSVEERTVEDAVADTHVLATTAHLHLLARFSKACLWALYAAPAFLYLFDICTMNTRA